MTHNRLNTFTIAILGAGLLGRLMAWRLLLEGYQVFLIEAETFTSSRAAAFTAAGMISPLSELASCEKDIYDLGLASLELWPQWLQSLHSNRPLFFAKGSIALAHPQDQVELRQFYRDISHKLKGEALQARWLNAVELTQLEAQLGHFDQGIFLPNEAHIDNRRLLSLLLDGIKKLGGACIENCPIHVNQGELSEESKRNLKQSGIYKAFNYLIDCRGMGAKSAANPLRGVRGEVLWIETKEVSFQRPIRLMHPRYKLYAVPKPNHQFIIGATEIESEDLSPISLQSTLELSSALYTLHPAFAEARVIETDTNLRPAYPDNLPRISLTDKIMNVNGLYRHGFLLAPALVAHSIQQLNTLLTTQDLPENKMDETLTCKIL